MMGDESHSGEHFSAQPSMGGDFAATNISGERLEDPLTPEVHKRTLHAEQHMSDVESKIKKINKQLICRSLVFSAAFMTCILGVMTATLGIYALGALWMPTAFGRRHTDEIAVSSTTIGVVLACFSLLGCWGAIRRKKPCFLLFCLVVAVLLAIFAGSICVASSVSWSLSAWEARGYRLDGAAAVLGPMPFAALQTLQTLFVELSALYAYCAPNASAVGGAVGALDVHDVPPPVALVCRDSSSSSASFAGWVNSECFAPARFALNHSASLLAQIAECRADLDHARARGLFVQQGGPFVGDTAWLFCACAQPLHAVRQSRVPTARAHPSPPQPRREPTTGEPATGEPATSEPATG